MREGTSDAKTSYWLRRYILLNKTGDSEKVDRLYGYDALLLTAMEYPALLLQRDMIASAVSKGFGGESDATQK